jgi:hypothetical protein
MRARLRAVSALVRRIEAGETIEAPAGAARATTGAGTAARATQDIVPPQERLPRGFGWMCTIDPKVRQAGAAFVDMLNEPWMTAKVLATPERMAGLIAPILAATGQGRPEWFPVSPARVRAGHAEAKCSLPPCGEGAGGLEPAAAREAVDSELGSCGGRPSPAPPARGGGKVLAPIRMRIDGKPAEFRSAFAPRHDVMLALLERCAACRCDPKIETNAALGIRLSNSLRYHNEKIALPGL